MHGRGFTLGPDGGVFEGYMYEGTPTGKGMLIDAIGNVCIGSWKNGLSDGFCE